MGRSPVISLTAISRSAEETRRWGAKLARLLQGGEIIGLNGELGVGKTCFVRGVAQGLKVSRNAWIRSPSFTLINEYDGRLPIYHIDLYRINSREETEGLNLREYFYGEGVSLVEWFEHLPSGEVDEYLEVRLVHAGGNRRRLNFIAHGERYERIIERLGVKRFKGSKVQKFKHRRSSVH
jgi:tRNA threonylcarbamoyladenosine biosynthesis protein TsaE